MMKTLLQPFEPSMVDLHAQLEVMLPRLSEGLIAAIEYGEVSAAAGNRGIPMGMYSAFRIVRTPTWAGPQFAIKPILNGGFGSGDYVPLEDQPRVLAKALQMVIRFHRPVESQNPKMREFINKVRSRNVQPQLSFFEVPK